LKPAKLPTSQRFGCDEALHQLESYGFALEGKAPTYATVHTEPFETSQAVELSEAGVTNTPPLLAPLNHAIACLISMPLE